MKYIPLPMPYEQGKCYSLSFTHNQNDKYANPIYPKLSPNMDRLNPIYTYVDYILKHLYLSQFKF
jgi:hypothetical protein